MKETEDRMQMGYYVAFHPETAVTFKQHVTALGEDVPIMQFKHGLDALNTARMILNDLQPAALQNPGPWRKESFNFVELFGKGAWTRSNGGLVSRLYERLTKASRRAEEEPYTALEQYYRQGVYDFAKALQEELSN